MIEKKLAQLEECVEALESEDIHLQNAIKKYTKCLSLASEISELITTHQNEVKVLQQETDILLSQLNDPSHA